MKNIAVGIIEITKLANNKAQSDRYIPVNSNIPTGKVLYSLLFIITKENKNSFQIPIKLIIATPVIEPFDIGTTIYKNIFNSLQPSNFAASIISLGNFLKYECNKIMLKGREKPT